MSEKICRNCRFFEEHQHRGMSYNDGVCRADGAFVAFEDSCVAFKEFIPDIIPVKIENRIVERGSKRVRHYYPTAELNLHSFDGPDACRCKPLIVNGESIDTYFHNSFPVVRNKTLGQLFRLQDGKCYFCEGEMEKGPYEGKGGFKQVRPNQAVKAHLHSRLSEERKTNPIAVAAHYRCQQQRSRKDILVDHRREHLMKSFRGIMESA